MRRRWSCFWVAWMVWVMGVPPCAADQDTAAEIEGLKARIAQLEAQNQRILALLEELTGEEAEGVSSPPEPPEPPELLVTEAPAPHRMKVGNSYLSFYGFVRVDAIFDDSRPDSIQSPGFILSEGDGALEDEDSFNFHPRLTRFGMNYAGPRIGGDSGPALSGRIEIDFQNGGRESREALRMRHGYLRLAWAESSLLLGQTWDVVSPLYPTVNSDSMMWNAGNLGDRRPQIRYSRRHETARGVVDFTGGIGLTGAINAQDLDGDGIRDGDDAVLPNLQARLGYASSRGAGKWSVGLSGHFGQEEVQTPVGGEDHFDSYSLNLDYQVALSSRWNLQGEVWTGSHLSDFRGGIGQSLNTTTGESIDSSGGWIEVGAKVSDRHSIFGGVTLDDPDDDQIAPGGRTRNSSVYLVNRWSFGKAFLVGLDLLRWETEFQGLADGTDNRLNLYVVYNF